MSEITPEMLEAAARKLCEIDGFDPDENASHFVEGLLWSEYTESAREIVSAALTAPRGSLRRYALVFDGEEGWTMLPDPAGEYVKFEDVANNPKDADHG